MNSRKTWGPHVEENGAVTFRLWAPSQQRVELELKDRTRPMMRREDGWFSITVDDATIGDRYMFRLADGTRIPDPASRFQPEGVCGPSQICASGQFEWQASEWKGRPWAQAIVYETHIGTFTKEGTYGAAIEHLQYLADIGFTAVEIMPLAQFPGQRGWGYDGVFQYAPHNTYGAPDEFRLFIDAAHKCGLMVFLDVVYNHFGPEGNFLATYAPQFFLGSDPTPWGARIAYNEPAVRQYFVENALYWLEEFHLDGLRLDAVDQITDDSGMHILQELSDAVREHFPHVHLITENPANAPDLLSEGSSGRRLYSADWNDDFHHALHVAVTGEKTGFYAEFKDRSWRQVKQALTEGYLCEGTKTLDVETLPPSASLPPTAFVHFLQNHDQVGNRALGERLHTMVDEKIYRFIAEILFLSPQIPLMFMGDDHLSQERFRFFCDYKGDLARNIYQSRYKELENFGGYPQGAGPQDVVDPNAPSTFESSKLDWNFLQSAKAKEWGAFLKKLIEIRKRHIMPLLFNASGHSGRVVSDIDEQIFLDWRMGESLLHLRANASHKPCDLPGNHGMLIYESPGDHNDRALHSWSLKLFISKLA